MGRGGKRVWGWENWRNRKGKRFVGSENSRRKRFGHGNEKIYVWGMKECEVVGWSDGEILGT
jgi:hypothetical protein